MKKIERLKLSQLGRVVLEKNEMNLLKGGDYVGCGCGCYYEGQVKGSTSAANAQENQNRGILSPGCQGSGCACVEFNNDGYAATSNPTQSVHA
jgi:natural product precursor